MMKKENIIYLFFPLIFVFYFFQMKGHVGFWEESNFFLLYQDYWQGFATKPGGWSEYLGHFVVQFYKWPVVAALVLTLLPFLVFLLTRRIAGKLEIPSSWIVVGVVPFLLVWGIQSYMGVMLGEVLKLVWFYFFLWAYLLMPRPWARYLVFTLLFPLVYLFLSPGGCVLLYLTFILCEAIRGKERYRWGISLLWAVLLGAYPSLWQRWFYLMPDSELYAFSVIKDAKEILPFLVVLYGYGIVLLGIAFAGTKMKKTGKRFSYICQLAVVVALAGYAYSHFYQKNTEYMLRMDQAVQQGRWEDVLKLVEKVEAPDRAMLFYVNLALANRQEIGDKLFNYPVWGQGCLYFPRDLDYMTCIFNGEFYYWLNIPNEALHWTLQASVASPLGMNFRALKRLVDISIRKDDRQAADKYLAILERSMLNGGWIKERRARLEDPKTEKVLPQDANDFFIGGRPFLSDMARVLDGGRNMDMSLDYILCGLLLNKDLGKFCQLFTHFYPANTGKRLPKAYEEALLVAISMGKADLEASYAITPEGRNALQEFNALLRTCGKDKEGGAEIMKGFKNTWWYYFHFTDQKLTDVQGRMVGDIQIIQAPSH